MQGPLDDNSRRKFLWSLGGGLGGVALAQMLGLDSALADDGPNPKSREAFAGGLHFPAKVKRVIQLFMNGGASQMDLFDYKPELYKRHGQKFDPGAHVEAATSAPGNVLKPPFEFKQHGKCGRWVSSVLPYTAACVDELTFLMAMQSKTNVHGPGSYMMNTGFVLPGFPSMGAWLSYGLGSLNDNLPTFVVLPDPKGLPYNSKGNFTSGFLPVSHQGTIIHPGAAAPIPNLFPAEKKAWLSGESQAASLALLKQLNQEHLAARDGDSRLEARIASYELAAKMQMSAPDALDLSSESEATKKLYGLDEKVTEDFGKRCLIGRRLLERGVRFVQIWSGAGGPKDNWDNHANIQKELPPMAAATDKPAAALLRDLRTRGLLDDTLLVWTTEFGRMPFAQDSVGRDHNGGTFVTWMAGAGLKPGTAHGRSDEWSWKAVEGKTYCYDLHATILHLMGIDHEKLTFRHNGIDRRLTDVHGHLIKEVLV